MHLIFVPAFAIHDCSSYYHAFCRGVRELHTLHFLQLDGYTQSGRRCLGDVSLATLVDACVAECNLNRRPYILVGHSTGTLIVNHIYARLEPKPVSVVLLNPITRHPRLRLCRQIPLFTPVLRLLDLLPIPLITTVFNGTQFGTADDVAPAMKYRLWVDLCSASATTQPPPPAATTTVVLSTRDGIGNGGETIPCDDRHMTAFPGHASFRSLECMAHVLSRLGPPSATTFESLSLSHDSL